MMMAVASDLPQIENQRQFGAEHNSYLYDDMGRPIGLLRTPQPQRHRRLSAAGQVQPAARSSRSRTSASGTTPASTLKGIGRAIVADATGGATQGASTIAEQFVKNALAQEGDRTILEKLREAALAFQLTHRWSKQKILREYLNSIYFGNGAYGIESAARVYFGKPAGVQPGHQRGRLEPLRRQHRRSSTCRRAPRCCAPIRRRCWRG